MTQHTNNPSYHLEYLVETPLGPLLKPSAPLIGRAADLAAVGKLLHQAHIRLISILGPGGIGKTSLALALLAAHKPYYSAGICFLDLSPLQNPADILPALADALEIKEEAGKGLIEQVAQHLQGRRLLLCGDNFEHLLAGRDLISQLLQTCPQLKIIITSRQALHLRGEQEYLLEPLALPKDTWLTVDDLAAVPAVALFVAQAQRVQNRFRLSAANAAAVAQLCIRLDGLPLALELAAPHIKLFSPAELLKHLSEAETGLHLLSGGPYDAPPRQQTLHRTIAWSYQLLAPAEQNLLRQLAVFVGGFTLAAMAALPALQENKANPLTALTALVDKCLVQVLRPSLHAPEQETRFTLLETIRAFALEKLKASAELEAVQLAHATYFLHLAETAAPKLKSNAGETWFKRLHRNRENFAAALSWCLADQAPPTQHQMGLGLAAALSDYWHFRGHLTEGIYWLQQALRGNKPNIIPAQAPVGNLQAHLYTALGTLHWAKGDYHQATTYHQISLRYYQHHHNLSGQGFALNNLAVQASELADFEAALKLFEASLAVYQQAEDVSGQGLVLNNLGALSEDIGDYATAESYYQQSYHLHQQQGEPLNIAIAALNLGEVARQQGHWQQANHHYQESFRLAEPLQYQVLLSTLYLRLAVLALQAQNFSQAIQYLQTGLPLLLDFKVWNDLPLALKTLADVSLALEQAEWACQALAIAEPLYRPLASAAPPANLAQRKQQLRQQLGAKTFQHIWQTSQSTPPEKFIRQLLPHLSHSPQAAKKALPPLANLTRREADVARLVACGLTNQEIASELTIVIKTVEKHLANVMSKLNCRNRAEVAAKMAATGLDSTPR